MAGSPRSLGRSSVASAVARIDDISRSASVLRQDQDPGVREIGELLTRFLDEGAEGSLDALLGLCGRGGVSARHALKLVERDALLRDLAGTHEPWIGLDASTVARQMSEASERYEGGRWVRDQASVLPPAGEPELTFWRIRKSGQRVPGPRQLRAILDREIHTPV